MPNYYGKDSHRFTFKFLRQGLSEWYFSNYDIETIQRELEDNWVRDELESMLRRGWKLEEAINQLIRKGKISLW